MNTSEFCANCGKEHLTWYARRFCSEQCKIDFFNTERKIKRAEDRARKAIELLRSLSNGESDIGLLAYKAIDNIHDSSTSERDDRLWVCNHCGQRVFTKPAKSQPCHFCTNTDWTLRFSGTK